MLHSAGGGRSVGDEGDDGVIVAHFADGGKEGEINFANIRAFRAVAYRKKSLRSSFFIVQNLGFQEHIRSG